MTKFLLRVAAIVLFCSFAAVSGVFASTYQDAGSVQRLSESEETEFQICRRACDHVFEHSASLCRKIPEKNTKARERCWRECNEERAQCYSDCT